MNGLNGVNTTDRRIFSRAYLLLVTESWDGGFCETPDFYFTRDETTLAIASIA